MRVGVTREVEEPLRTLDRHYRGGVCTVAANAYEVEKAVLDAYLVIGAVLVPGERAPRLVSDARVAAMRPGSVLVVRARELEHVGVAESIGPVVV